MKVCDVRKLLNLNDNIDIIKVEKRKEKGKNNNYIYIKSNKKKARCPICNCFSKKVHDYLRPSKITYLKAAEDNIYLIMNKRRFYCAKCKKSFTENLGISGKNEKISHKVKQLILKKCMDRDMTLEAIATECNVSASIVRKTFIEATENFPSHVKTLPEVISFDEVSTYTKGGVYSFILNDPIHRITLDILPSRNKDFLIKYFKKVKNRESVKVVICDLHKPYYQVVKICFPNAIFAGDPFHYTRYVTDGVDNVRIRLENQYNEDKKSKEYRLLKNRINRKLILKSFNETRGEIKKIKRQEDEYNQGIRNRKPYNKFNDFWYGKIKVKKNNKYIEVLLWQIK